VVPVGPDTVNTSHMVYVQEALSVITSHPLFSDIVTSAPLEIGDATDRLHGLIARIATAMNSMFPYDRLGPPKLACTTNCSELGAACGSKPSESLRFGGAYGPTPYKFTRCWAVCNPGPIRPTPG